MLINFDYDGVIVDSFEILYQQSLQAQVLTGFGRPPTRQDIRTLTNMTFEDLARECDIPVHHILTFVNHVFNLQRQAVTLPILFPGMADQLKQLASRHTLTIITSSSQVTVEQTLQQHDLTSTISLILDGSGASSKSERIKRAQQVFDVPATETYMVGDAMSDIRQGKLAGVCTVAVTWGFQSKQLLLTERPDYIVNHPADLLSLFSIHEQHI